MATAFSGLNRLLNNLRSAHHDFKPTTEVFAPLDIEKIASDMQLGEFGESRGKENLPASHEAGLDEIDLSIFQRVDEAKSTAFKNLEDELHHFSVRLTNLDFQEQFSFIKMVAGQSLTDFQGEVVNGRNELHTLRRNLNIADKDLANFQKKNKLERGVIATDGSKQFLKWTLLVFFFVCEWIANGFLLAEGSRLGFIGGVLEAGLFSLLNVMGTVIITMFGIRNLIHRSFLRKFAGLVSLVVYIAFALTLNLVLAHYREISGNLVDGVGKLAFESFMANPLGLSDVKSWMLFGAGLFVSIATMIDTLYLGDPYMGYQAVHKRREDAEEEYKHAQADLIENLINLRDDHHEKINDIIEELKRRRREHSDIIAHRAKVLTLFNEHQTHLERALNQLVRKYRDANIAARTTPPPKHFRASYKLERLKPTYSKENELTEKEITSAMKKAQAELTAQIEAIAKACEEGIREYRELDNLFPEERNG